MRLGAPVPELTDTRPSFPFAAWRPGLRALVLTVSGVLVIVTAVAVAITVSDHLRSAAVGEAVRTTESVVRGFVDPSVTKEALADPSGPAGTAIDDQLAQIVRAGKLLRIKVWAPNGTVVFSDLPALRGRTFELEQDLQDVLRGGSATEFSDGTDAENEFERGLADRLLSIYLPIRASDGSIVGAYEIYEDAAPIEADIAHTSRDVLLIVGAMAIALLALLFLAFSGTSRRLTLQNRQLRERALTEQVLTADLRRSQERFRSLVQNSADVNMVLRPDGMVEYESPAVERVLGFRPEEHEGRSASEFVHPDDVAWAEQLLAEVSPTPGAQVSVELRLRHADGSWRMVEAVGRNLVDDPAVGGIVVNYRDITARKALEEELRHQAFHDSLTGLANRALFTDRLEHALARTRRGTAPLAVLFVDLDDFKNINDSLGHGEGDAILQGAAQRLKGAVRAGDTIARMGGDEFAILVEDPPDSTAPLDVAQRLLAALQEPFDQAGKELFIHASIGVAVASGPRVTAAELLRNADVSMYTAKNNGKSRIELYEPRMHAEAMVRLALRVDLERALERGEFFVLYQPVLQLATRRMVGVEALLRWRHPERGVVPPGDFIPIAEETGLIDPIGRWVLEEACRQLRSWDDAWASAALTMSVNVSARQLTDPGFVDEVASLVADAEFAPGRLILELTEGVLLRDSEATLATLRGLKQAGVRLAIDDFGTGYSSLSYLRQFPIDMVKIDRSFVASMANGPDETALMQSILKLSDTLHLETVAEGIEEAGQLEQLRTLGADLGQGFLFARPLDPEAIGALLADGGSLDEQAADRGAA
jgi:diguanylate cyclase (GGDEF)-like protein/PAS domain S-box-containing protein